jgi:hypothetical protein
VWIWFDSNKAFLYRLNYHQNVFFGAELFETKDELEVGSESVETAGEEEDGVGPEGSEGDCRLHWRWEGGASPYPRRAHHRKTRHNFKFNCCVVLENVQRNVFNVELIRGICL